MSTLSGTSRRRTSYIHAGLVLDKYGTREYEYGTPAKYHPRFLFLHSIIIKARWRLFTTAAPRATALRPDGRLPLALKN